MSVTAARPSDQARAGACAAAVCYTLWGLVPLYWRQLTAVSPLELIAHRHVWSLALLLLLVFAQKGFGDVLDALRTRRSIARNLLSASLLTGNWLVYVWGVNTGHVIETSLGYFLVPLVNVAAGRFVLHEHLRRAQWFAIGLAVTGVALMIVQLGRPPWIALVLAGTWGGYSLMRKQSTLGSMYADARREELDRITERIIGCAQRVSNVLGCGFLEKVYENALVIELRKSGIVAEQQRVRDN